MMGAIERGGGVVAGEGLHVSNPPTTRGERSLRAAMLATASLIALAVLGAPGARAACSNVDQTIAESTPGPVFGTGGSITVLGRGDILGDPQGVFASTCSITALSNNGAVSGGVASPGGAVASAPGLTIGQLTNSVSGTIVGGMGQTSIAVLDATGGAGVANGGAITTFANGGAVGGGTGGNATLLGASGGAGVSNLATGTIGLLGNGGTIDGGNAGNGLVAGGAGGAGLANSGAITTVNDFAAIGGGAGGVGASGVGGAGGAGAANGLGATIVSLNIEKTGEISGGGGGAGGAGGTAGAGVSNAGTIGSLKVAGSGLNNLGSILGGFGFAPTGGGAGGVGVMNSGTITTLSNNNLIAGGGSFNLTEGGAGLTNSGAITTLSNGGMILGAAGELGASAQGAGGQGLTNSGTITTLTNGGAIGGGDGGFSIFKNSGGSGGAGGVGLSNANGATIASLSIVAGGKITGGAGGAAPQNAGEGIFGGAGADGFVNQGAITTLTNDGNITGGKGGDGPLNAFNGFFGGAGGNGVVNQGAITTLTNTGSITGGLGGTSGGFNTALGGDGLVNSGPITTQKNSGAITGAVAGELNIGTIGSLDNLSGGVISGAQFGVENVGVIVTLNNAGVISDPGFAVFSTGSIGRIVNAGQIIGNVEIDNQSVTITGGGGQGKTTFGSLKGGAITIRDGDLAFAGGATDLADNIVVQDGGKVTNDGVLRLAAPQTIAGGFSQGGSGVLDLEIAGDRFGQYGALTVAGLATLGGELALDPINGFRLGAGDSFDLLSFGADFGSFTGVSVGGVPCSGGLSDVWACPVGFSLDISLGPGGLDVTTAAIPEPSVWTLMLLGFAGLGCAGWRRRGGATFAA
jgi:PEP-CTERM motif